MQCDVTRCVICISSNIEYFNKEQGFFTMKLYCEFKCSLQCNKENTAQIMIGIQIRHSKVISTVPFFLGHAVSYPIVLYCIVLHCIVLHMHVPIKMQDFSVNDKLFCLKTYVVYL